MSKYSGHVVCSCSRCDVERANAHWDAMHKRRVDRIVGIDAITRAFAESGWQSVNQAKEVEDAICCVADNIRETASRDGAGWFALLSP